MSDKDLIVELGEKIGKTHESMKEQIDAGVKETADFGRRLGDTEERLEKHNVDLDKWEVAKTALEEKAEKLEADLAAAHERIDALRAPATSNERHGISDVVYNGSDLKAFQKWVRGGELNIEERKVMTVADSTTGGFLAPPEMLNEMIKGVIEYSPFRQMARVRQTSLRAVKIPRRTQTGSALWVGEIEERVETQNPKIGMIEIPTHEMYARILVSVQDLEDTQFDLQGFITEESSEQFAVAEAAAFVDGDGSLKPRGFLNDPDATLTQSGDANALTADGFINCAYDLKTFYANSAAWGLNRKSIGEVRKLKETTDGNYLWVPGLAAGEAPTILDSPYVEMSDLPLVTAGARAVVYGDWRRAYMIVDRVSVSIVRDDLTQADVGQVKFLFRKRLGGQVTLPEAYRVMEISA